MPKNKIKYWDKKLKTLRNKPDSGATGRKKVDVLTELAYEYYASNPKKTEVYGKQALALSEKIGFKNGAARSYTVLGISHWVRGENDIALGYFTKSLKIFEEVGEKRGVADSYGNIANIYYSQSDYEKALQNNVKALAVCKEIDYKRGIGNVYINVGIIYDEQGDYERSLESKLKALKIFQKIGDERVIATSLCDIGNLYFQQEDSNRALEYYFEALKNCDKTREMLIAANCFDGIGGVYCKQGNYEEALKYSRKALQIFEEIDDKGGFARVLNSIAEICNGQGEYESALEYQHKAMGLFVEIGNKRGLANSYKNLASAHIHLKHYESAINYLQKGIHLARAIEARDLEMNCYENLYKLYQEQQQYDQALSYFMKYHTVEREIFNASKSKQIAIMTTRYETDKKEKEAEIYRLKSVDLQKEVRQRKKAEKELKKHRDYLEELVEKRTIELKRELTKRQRAEKELLKYQSQLIALNHALSLVEEKQRRKTAAYLHDNISQALSLAIFKIRSLQKSGPVKNVSRELAEIKEIVAQTNQRTRSLTFEISPPVLYELGLEPAVEWLAGQFQTQHSITCSFKNDGSSKPLKDEARILLFQAVRELLTNISKHARAQTVKVSISKHGNAIRISVEDDGVGFNPENLGQKITHNEGFGLFNIKERLRYLGGKVEVNSEKGKGTSVVLNAPLKRTPGKAKRKRR